MKKLIEKNVIKINYNSFLKQFKKNVMCENNVIDEELYAHFIINPFTYSRPSGCLPKNCTFIKDDYLDGINIFEIIDYVNINERMYKCENSTEDDENEEGENMKDFLASSSADDNEEGNCDGQRKGKREKKRKEKGIINMKVSLDKKLREDNCNPKKNKFRRIYRFLLFDGRNYIYAYEREFNERFNYLETNKYKYPKIILYNRPVIRRGAILLKRNQAAILFRGCRVKKASYGERDIGDGAPMNYATSSEVGSADDTMDDVANDIADDIADVISDGCAGGNADDNMRDNHIERIDLVKNEDNVIDLVDGCKQPFRAHNTVGVCEQKGISKNGSSSLIDCYRADIHTNIVDYNKTNFKKGNMVELIYSNGISRPTENIEHNKNVFNNERAHSNGNYDNNEDHCDKWRIKESQNVIDVSEEKNNYKNDRDRGSYNANGDSDSILSSAHRPNIFNGYSAPEGRTSHSGSHTIPRGELIHLRELDNRTRKCKHEISIPCDSHCIEQEGIISYKKRSGNYPKEDDDKWGYEKGGNYYLSTNHNNAHYYQLNVDHPKQSAFNEKNAESNLPKEMKYKNHCIEENKVSYEESCRSIEQNNCEISDFTKKLGISNSNATVWLREQIVSGLRNSHHAEEKEQEKSYINTCALQRDDAYPREHIERSNFLVTHDSSNGCNNGKNNVVFVDSDFNGALCSEEGAVNVKNVHSMECSPKCIMKNNQDDVKIDEECDKNDRTSHSQYAENHNELIDLTEGFFLSEFFHKSPDIGNANNGDDVIMIDD
ncbi:conserved Plasmodium protein, unknown function [Plasmodium ovale wallikeri]|uniref:Uncharacterized protein n=2 Tax=Plasmodium ovale TaxID=36330 RepID=A0A1A8YRC9_PLAOA|nr:conserved Plasmodium protein, unknown function [Plasmodium ovale wallikeri]SBT50643.1 conserved Plasmodium protein, unknown function [Plasmodium ovale wallikeri]SBT76722.1 conserved Plasmodium protein, unknown function [Plasmodium ovale]